MLVRAEQYREAVDLLNRHGEWERAHQLAAQYLGADIVRDMFIEMAARLELEAKYRDAEKVLLTIDEPDMAISMYKRLEQYDAMIRLVERYHRDLVPSTHLHLARQLEAKLRLKAAEVHYLAADDWKAAVHMYGNAGRWEEAYRVAKQQKGAAEGAADQVAYMWARSLPIDAASRLLVKMGLVERALAFACEAGQYPFALELCQKSGHPADGVHLKLAMELEDEGKFAEAEAAFLLANKPKEAVLMHTHSRDWRAAVRVAEQHLPEAVGEVLLSQAAEALEAQNYAEYEALLIRANRTDVVLEHYREYEMWPEAIRIAKEYVPAALAELQRQQAHALQRTGGGGGGSGMAAVGGDSRELLQRASDYARQEEFRRAADCLLLINETNADAASVERALLRAAEIGNQFLDGTDAVEVARQLGPRLVELRHIGPAAQLFLAADLPREAVQVFMHTDNWSKARRLAREIGSEMVAYVEAEQKQRLRMEGNVEQLADIGRFSGDLRVSQIYCGQLTIICPWHLHRHRRSPRSSRRAGTMDALHRQGQTAQRQRPSQISRPIRRPAAARRRLHCRTGSVQLCQRHGLNSRLCCRRNHGHPAAAVAAEHQHLRSHSGRMPGDARTGRRRRRRLAFAALLSAAGGAGLSQC